MYVSDNLAFFKKKLMVILKVNTYILPKPRFYFKFIFLKRITLIPLVKRSLSYLGDMSKFLILDPKRTSVYMEWCFLCHAGSHRLNLPTEHVSKWINVSSKWSIYSKNYL